MLGIAVNATAGNLNTIVSMNYVISADATTIYNQGVEQAREGHYNRAERSFKKALQKDSKHVDSLSYLAQVYASKGQYSNAISTAKKVLKLDPNNEGANQILARIYETRSSWKKMVSPLNTLTQNYENNSRYFAKLGEVHYRLT
jgi:tetratricopeptide (TPR) repeat protein